VGLYYESLCPYSANFIVNYLVKIFEDDFISIVDLNLVPWGNARIKANNSVNCQHGPNECLLNTVEACAIEIWPELNKHFPFIYCIESLVYERKYTQWEKCFEKLDLDSKPITGCYTSEHGKKLELQYAAETAALKPPHQYVPWVVVDGQPLYEDYENFLSYICKAYKGIAAPRICSEKSLNTIKMRTAKFSRPVCYKEETKKSAFSTRIRSAIASWMQ
jgi:interferon gamma-inducible protein 30